MKQAATLLLCLGLVLVIASCGGAAPKATPTSAIRATPTASAATPTPSPPPSQTQQADQTTYVVQSGDSLYSISLKFNTTVEVIASANKIANPDVIAVGQQLIIPKSSR